MGIWLSQGNLPAVHCAIFGEYRTDCLREKGDLLSSIRTIWISILSTRMGLFIAYHWSRDLPDCRFICFDSLSPLIIQNTMQSAWLSLPLIIQNTMQSAWLSLPLIIQNTMQSAWLHEPPVRMPGADGVDSLSIRTNSSTFTCPLSLCLEFASLRQCRIVLLESARSSAHITRPRWFGCAN